MAAIAIVGESGTGKSTSLGKNPDLGIKGLEPSKTVIINVAGKDLPFRGWKKLYDGTKKISEGANYTEASGADVIAATITHINDKRPDIDYVVLDDSQYIMAFEFMNRAKESGYGKFADLGVNIGKVVKAAKEASRLKVFFLWHPEKSADTGFKMKTVGKMVDDYLTLEGLFTVILYTKVTKGADNKMSYKFVTNQDGQYPAKSPYGMFKDQYIPNDLGLVNEMVDAYNNGE